MTFIVAVTDYVFASLAPEQRVLAPLVLAMILGPQIEASLRRSLIYSRGDLGVFFQRPIAATLIALALLMLLSPIFRWGLSRKFSAAPEPATSAEVTEGKSDVVSK